MEQMTRIRTGAATGEASAPGNILRRDVGLYEAGRGEKRREVWVWTAVAEQSGGSGWGCFEAGDRSKDTLSELLLQLLRDWEIPQRGDPFAA